MWNAPHKCETDRRLPEKRNGESNTSQLETLARPSHIFHLHSTKPSRVPARPAPGNRRSGSKWKMAAVRGNVGVEMKRRASRNQNRVISPGGERPINSTRPKARRRTAPCQSAAFMAAGLAAGSAVSVPAGHPRYRACAHGPRAAGLPEKGKGQRAVIARWPRLRRDYVCGLVIPAPWLCAAGPLVDAVALALMHALWWCASSALLRRVMAPPVPPVGLDCSARCGPLSPPCGDVPFLVSRRGVFIPVN